MNRLIKFRAWDFEKNIMLDKHDESDGALSGVHFGLPPSFETVNNRYAWMQFTGLHDKNGKEIYEGDIVRMRLVVGIDENEEDVIEETVDQVEYTDEFCFYPLCDFFMNEGDTIEVIGNIYENPELLTN